MRLLVDPDLVCITRRVRPSCCSFMHINFRHKSQSRTFGLSIEQENTACGFDTHHVDVRLLSFLGLKLLNHRRYCCSATVLLIMEANGSCNTFCVVDARNVKSFRYVSPRKNVPEGCNGRKGKIGKSSVCPPMCICTTGVCYHSRVAGKCLVTTDLTLRVNNNLSTTYTLYR